MTTAAARAAHLVVDREPWLFEDTLAAALLGDEADDLLAAHREPAHADILASLRVAMTTRSRYTEERLSEAAGRGVEQCVVLGAGLDSFAYRAPVARRLRVFEVDHPATQAWKRRRLAAAAIPVPDALRFVAVDFTADSLADRLRDAGFDRALADYFMPRAAAFGEPWLTFLTPSDVAALLAVCGMDVLDDAPRRDQIDAALWQRADGLRPHELGRQVRAVVVGQSGAR
jgi:methyltransferase (TIGR00027 family)